MADRYAVASGNWSNSATWDGGTLPGASDDVYADGFTVTIDQDVTVLSIRTTQRSGGTNGGSFSVSATGLTITADFHKGTNVSVLAFYSAGGLSVIGNTQTNNSGSSSYFLNNLGNGSIDWTGNITAGGANGRHGVRLQSGTIVVTGDVTGGSSSNSYGILNDGGSVTINGDAIADIGPAVGCDATGNVVVVNGDLRPSAVAPAIAMYDASGDRGDLILNGDIIDHSSGQSPTHFGKLLIHASDELTHTYRTDNSGTPGVARSLYTGGVNLGQPVEADVRAETVFGASGEYTGSLAVADPQYVSQGVPTDDTVGTLEPGLDEASLHTALDSYANKANWKATGFSTHNAAAVVSGLQAVANDFKATGFATPANVSAVETKVDTLLTRITATLFNGLTSLPNWLRKILRNDYDDATTDTEIGGTFDDATDSLQAIRDRGDAAWTSNAAGDATEAKQDSILAALSGKVIKVTSRTINGNELVSYIGDDDVDDNAQSVVIDDVGETIKTKLQAATSVSFGAGLDSANEVVGTIATGNITHASNRTTIPVEITSANKPTKPNPNYEWHIKSVDGDGNEFVEVIGTLDLRPERRSL